MEERGIYHGDAVVADRAGLRTDRGIEFDAILRAASGTARRPVLAHAGSIIFFCVRLARAAVGCLCRARTLACVVCEETLDDERLRPPAIDGRGSV